MDRTKAVLASLYAAALSLWLAPALAVAQSSPATQPGSTPAPVEPGATGSTGGSILWVVAALVVLAIIWWAMSSRRRGAVTR